MSDKDTKKGVEAKDEMISRKVAKDFIVRGGNPEKPTVKEYKKGETFKSKHQAVIDALENENKLEPNK